MTFAKLTVSCVRRYGKVWEKPEFTRPGDPFMARSKNFDREYENAVREAVKSDTLEPRAKSARFDKRSRRIVVDLRNGARFSSSLLNSRKARLEKF